MTENKQAGEVLPEAGRLGFPEDRGFFRILQLTDMQIIGLGCTRNPVRDRQIKGTYFKEGVPDMDARCFQYVNELVRRTKPDLIALTGDNVYGEFDDDGAMSELLCRRMEEYGIPWAPVFGNHDNESRIGVRRQMKMFGECPHCLFADGGVTGHGNYFVRILSGGRDVFTLFFLDTNGCRNVGNPWAPEEGITPDNIDYDLVEHREGIFPDQTAAFRAAAGSIAAENGRRIPSAVFFHIPIAAYDLARAAAGYVFKENFDYNGPDGYGGIYEHNIHKIDSDGAFYRASREAGTVGYFAGHEHKNDLCLKFDGAVFAYGVKTGIATYYRDEAIGGTVIDIDRAGELSVRPEYCRKRFDICDS